MTISIPAFAIVRVEHPFDVSAEPKNNITVVGVVATLEGEKSEVTRLGQMNGPEKCHYFWQATRISKMDLEHLGK